MAKINLIDQKWCDLIFEGRNKKYGAYFMRANAGKRTMWAFGVLILLIIGITAFGALASVVASEVVEVANEQATELSELEQEEQKEEEKKKEPEIPQEQKQEPQQTNEPVVPEKVQAQPAGEAVKAAATQIYTQNVVITENVKSDNALQTQSQLQNAKAMFGTMNYKGDGASKIAAQAGMHVGGTSTDPNAGKGVGGRGTSAASTQEVRKETSKDIVGKGDLKAEASYQGNWIQFLQSHLKYPAIAIDQETQGDVILEFVVELDGSISQVKVKKSLSKECDAEAIRVVKLARWNPAVDKNGNKVRSFHQQKITYQLR